MLSRQLPSALRLFAGAIRIGNSLSQAMLNAARESEYPIKNHFEKAVSDMGTGLPPEQCLQQMALMYPGQQVSRDLSLLATAVAVNRSTGGPLADILDSMVETLLERRRLKGQVEALTAQGRMSGWIVGLLPVFLLIAMAVIDPALVKPMFTTSLGLGLLGLALVLEILGAVFLKRLIEVKV